MKELRTKAVQIGVFDSNEAAPDLSTLHRALKKLGYKWQKPKYDDPRAQRTRVTYERCEFRKALENGLVDPTTCLCMD